jgi:hypothetical protein
LMGAQTWPWAGAALVGGVIVCLVGAIDAAFAMVDLSAARRGRGDVVESDSRGWRVKAAFLLKAYVGGARWGVIVRVGMVVASLLITSPFLAQLMFSTDIANLRKADYDRAVAEKTAAITTGYDQMIHRARLERDGAATAYSSEIAGKGLSGRYGEGPVARSLASKVVALDRQIKQLETEKDQKLSAFRNADATTRARSFGVAETPDGIAARFNALSRMEQIPGFRRAENAIRMILFGLFLGLLVLKWYEPRALEIYLDEELQDTYSNYRSGMFDHWHDRDKYPTDEMTPFAFHRWYYGTARHRLKAEEDKNRMAVISARQDEIEATVRRMSQGPGDDLAALLIARENRAKEFEAAAESVRQLNEQTATKQAELDQCEAELQNARETIAQEPRFSASAVLLKKQQAWEQRLIAASTASQLHVERLKTATEFRDARAKELRKLDDIIELQNDVMAQLAAATAHARSNALRDLTEG